MFTLSPKDKAALLSHAKSLISAGKLEAARLDLQRLVLADPKAAEGYLYLSRIAYETGDTPACLDHLGTALRLVPDNARLWANAADRYKQLNQSDLALAAYDKSIALAPRELRAKVDKAVYLQTLGHFDAAEKMFRKLLKAHPYETELYRIFLGAKSLRKADPLIRQMNRLWQDKRLNDAGRMHLGFALARVKEQAGDSDSVFGFLNQANAAQRRLAPDDPAARDAEISALQAAQDSDDYTPLGSEMALRPIFVSGMPRSGTTLVEQIIASHSRATSGGEMGHALKQATLAFGQGTAMTPLRELDAEALHKWAETYERLAQRDSGATEGIVTDKSIQSHLVFGLIRRGLPGARMIVVHRDPRDIALSIYKNFFRLGTHRYANDLASIAVSIKQFRESVAVWQTRLPGVIHEVHYDALVADPEPQARALVQAAGLDWEPSCLDFHQSKAAVQTLSLAQVREPIHARRSAAWRRYEKDLAPFIDAWGDTPWD